MSSQRPRIPRIFFDRRDHNLLHLFEEVVNRDQIRFQTQRAFLHHFHPRGIKELAESRGLRIAYAVIHLLESLESGQMQHRLNALRALRDEVMCSTSQELRMNTARVLIEIMKDLVRAYGDYERQLALAHSFRTAASGKPRIVRYFLKQYRLLEMPEEWNQLAFDDHVHDAYTKGRKSPTHLIMDAWVKGIRRLRVIHYNYIRPETAKELIEAAAIMGIMLRIGIEYSAAFYDRFAQFIWVPRGFADARDFLRFLNRPDVCELMEQGRRVSDYQRKSVMEVLDAFNRRHRQTISAEFGLEMPPLDRDEFMEFVGYGQASLLHLAKFIHSRLLPLMQEKMTELRGHYDSADAQQREAIEALVARMNRMDADDIHHRFLTPTRNPDVFNPEAAAEEEMPELMRLSPCSLLDRLAGMNAGYRVTLNLSNMRVEDVLELLYDCGGRVSRLEIFNLKDYADCKVDHIPPIARLQQCINSANVIQLKRMILEIIEQLRQSETAAGKQRQRIQKLNWVLADMDSLLGMFRVRPLKSRIGSDSTGYSQRLPDMGLAVIDTLPRRSQREISRDETGAYMIIPFYVETFFRVVYARMRAGGSRIAHILGKLRAIPGFGRAALRRTAEWYAREDTTRMAEPGNIVTLSGFRARATNGLELTPQSSGKTRRLYSFDYLQTPLKNTLKVIVGFVPAFLTFYLTNDWWVLVWCGAFIWFGITGFRNIVQSVLAGGGLRRSPLLQWNDYVSWDRLTDSLLFTGFSVPLLDFFVKNLALHRGLGVTTASDPVLLYAVMALVNGVYLTSHNLFRGLPKEMAFANFFRTVLSIPVAFGLNQLLAGVLTMAGMVQVNVVLQSWAAVISKTASDCVAGIIEGLVDRAGNIRERMYDYRQKLRQFLDVYARLEMLFPESEVLDLLQQPENWYHSEDEDTRELIQILIVNALDLLYFWMYQPRARTAFRNFLREISEDERHVLIRAQSILKMEREISQMFIDGILGRHFSRPLAFYLNRYGEYLRSVEKLCG